MKETLRKINPRRLGRSGCLPLGIAFFAGVLATSAACEAHVAVGTPADGRFVFGVAIGDSLKTQSAISEAYNPRMYGPAGIINFQTGLDFLGVAARVKIVSSNPNDWNKIMEFHGPDIR